MKGAITWLGPDSWLRAIVILTLLGPIGVMWGSDGIISSALRRQVRVMKRYAPCTIPSPDTGKICLDNAECVSRWCKPVDDSNGSQQSGTCQHFPRCVLGGYSFMSHGSEFYVYK